MSKDTQLTEAQLFSITESAFAPYTCIPELTDYEKSFRFSVADPATKQHFKSEVVDKVMVSNASRLKVSIDLVRKQMEKAGLNLDPWEFPKI